MATGPALAARGRALDDHHRLIGAAELGLPGGRAAEEYYAMLTGLPAQDEEPDRDPAWQPRAPWTRRPTEPAEGADSDPADGAVTPCRPPASMRAPTPRADPGATGSTVPTNCRSWLTPVA